jgi:hypothetical protein
MSKACPVCKKRNLTKFGWVNIGTPKHPRMAQRWHCICGHSPTFEGKRKK